MPQLALVIVSLVVVGSGMGFMVLMQRVRAKKPSKPRVREPVKHVPIVLGEADLGRAQSELYNEGMKLVQPFVLVGKSGPRSPDHLARGVALLEEVVKRHPDNRPTHWALGMCYRASGERRRSYDAFRAATDHTNADVERELMFSCLMMGHLDEGLAAARRALALRPEDAVLRANLALALLLSRKVDEAGTEIARAVAAAPGDVFVLLVSGTIHNVRSGKQPQPTEISDVVSTVRSVE